MDSTEDKYEAAEDFVRNFFLERKSIIDSTFNFEGTHKSYLAAEIEKLDLTEEQKEKLKHIVSVMLTDTFYTILLGLDGATDIGESNQELYKVYDEQGRLISDCGELEAEAYEYFHENKYEMENPSCDFIALLDCQTKIKSGCNVKLKFDFDDQTNQAELEFIERNIVFPGEKVETKVSFINSLHFYGKLSYDQTFEVLEDENVIATGKVKQLIDENLRAV